MSPIHEISRIGLLTMILLTGCGQVAANAPLSAARTEAVAAASIRSQQEAIARTIKAQLERTMPDNTLAFRDLSVSALPHQNAHTFRGIVARGSIFGTSTWTVYGTFDMTTKTAKIGHWSLLKSARTFPYQLLEAQADDILDVTADVPTAAQARQDIKEQLEQAAVRPTSYSVISGIALSGLDPNRTTSAFKAHEREVGHGWERRYALEGTYEATTRKATVIKRETIYSNGSPWWTVGTKN
ncbi:MAG: hypothetical protein FJZ01_18375 [Candidatus Sericytochromatia bacterium]|nr:hypothetical protein [Candidatus Tanganyikabacteria bacterium]